MTATVQSARHARTPRKRVTPAEPPAFRRDVQGLRAVAVLLVIGCQVGLTGLGGGDVGIDLFLVISGFVITGSGFRELVRDGRLSLRRFYARRTTRMVPASAVVVLGTLAAAWHWLPPTAHAAISWDALAAATATMNMRSAVQSGTPPELSPLQHFWSLSLVAQFYLVWPALLIVASLAWARRGRPSVLAAGLALTALTAGSLALCLQPASAGQPWTFFGLPTRVWEFGLGALVALGARRLTGLPDALAAVASWLGLAAVAVAATAGQATSFPAPATLLAVLGTVLVLSGGCARPSWGARRLLRLTPLQELGRISFGWYLWHWPILVIAPYVLGGTLTTPAKAGLALAALVPAAMSVAAVENRIHLDPGLRRRPGRALALGGTLAAVTAGLALAAQHVPAPVAERAEAATEAAAVVSPSTFTTAQLHRLIRADSAMTVLPHSLNPGLARARTSLPGDGGCLVPPASRFVSDNIRRGCERHGTVGSGTVVVLFGDSHAQQWFDPLDLIAREHGWRLVVFTKAQCGAALGRVGRDGGPVPYRECDQWRLRALARIQQLRPELVVMSGRHHEASPLDVGVTAGPDQDWAAAWAATVTRVKLAGALPVVIQDTPVARRDVPACLAAHPTAVGQCHLEVFKSLSLSRQRVVRALVQVHGGRVIDSTAWFCTPSICPAVIGDTVVYRDDNHLTSAYAMRLAGVLDEALR